ncbi:MAG: histidine kinase dimerization/phospho-acceptor domain-containing protein, partial [Allorhizobium sp.]
MMQLNRHINPDFPVIHPYSGVNSITDELITSGYLVVMDENNKFWGILTPVDLIKRSHKIVADCLTPKDILTNEDNIVRALEKFLVNQSTALPFFDCNQLVGIVEKETLTKHILRSVDELFDKSEASDRLKKLILTNLSHEIRTPLNSIVGFLELIEEINTEDTQYSNFSAIIRKSAEHFLVFMNDLIDLSLIQSGHSFNISIAPCQLSPIFKETQNLFLSHFLYSEKKDV